MPLAIIEADGLHARKALQRPGETDGGVLAAGEQHERSFRAWLCDHDVNTLPVGRASFWISCISCADNAKSKIAKFSASRSTLLLRGITTKSCCSRKRRLTCAAVLPCALPIRTSTAFLPTEPLAIGL